MFYKIIKRTKIKKISECWKLLLIRRKFGEMFGVLFDRKIILNKRQELTIIMRRLCDDSDFVS